MNYFNNQILPHLQSPSIYMFGAGLAIATYCGKKLLYKYQKKLISSNHHEKSKASEEYDKSCEIRIKNNINNTTYFFMHFLFNMFCVYNCWGSVVSLIQNPHNITKVPNTMGVYTPLFHLYHIILCRNQIKQDELLHHLWVFIICPLMCINYTNLSDMGMFFLTGLPGGLTYLLLGLKNLHYIKDVTEKRISTHLNMWIRAPGCILTTYAIFLNYKNNNFGDLTLLRRFGVYLCMIGTYVNGIYFASTIIESHGITKYKESGSVQ